MWRFTVPERHPYWWTVVSLFVISAPEWLNSTWGLFSKEPLFVALVERFGGRSAPPFSPYYVSVPIGVLMFALVFRRHGAPWSNREEGRPGSLSTGVRARSQSEKSSSGSSDDRYSLYEQTFGDLPVRLCWGTHTAGLLIRAYGTAADVVNIQSAALTDLLFLWDRPNEKREWIKLPMVYPDGKFTELTLTGKGTAGRIGHVDLGTIFHGPDRLDFIGRGNQLHVSEPGTWKATCRVSDASGRQASHELAFRWVAKNMLPEPLADVPAI